MLQASSVEDKEIYYVDELKRSSKSSLAKSRRKLKNQTSLKSAGAGSLISASNAHPVANDKSHASLDLETPIITPTSELSSLNPNLISANNTTIESPYFPPEFNVVTINVAGLRFQTLVETLEIFPETLLGNPLRRNQFYNRSTQEYFFDRHRASFEAILYYYQSAGKLKRPESISVDVFLREIKFFELGEDAIDQFWAREGYRKPDEEPLPTHELQRKIFQLMEHPDTSYGARVVAFISVFVIILSTVSFCIETLPSIRSQYNHSAVENVTVIHFINGTNITTYAMERTYTKWNDPFFVMETCCIVWFTIEFILRFGSCPNKCRFVKSFLNVVDFVAIVPFYINLGVGEGEDGEGASSATSLAVLRVLRLVRVFRIFKLSRHSRGLQILGKTFTASVQELCLLVFFLAIGLVLFSSAVYFAESDVDETQFTSIPTGFWYAIVTMTTVGYGDLTPKGTMGRLVGSCCAIVGVLVLAMPVPVIVANFKHFYKQETRLAHMQMQDEDELDEVGSNSS